MAVLVQDAQFVKRRWAAHRCQFARLLILIQDSHETFGQTVKFVEYAGQFPYQVFFVFFMEGRADRAEHFERFQRFGGEIRRIEHGDDD